MSRSTSAVSWQSVQSSGLVSKMRLRVYNWLYVNGPSTRSELDAGMMGPAEVNPSYHKRLSELERMGLVEVGKERPCGITKRNCISWRTTDLSSPIPMVTRAKKPNPLAGIIEELSGWLDSHPHKEDPHLAELLRSHLDGSPDARSVGLPGQGKIISVWLGAFLPPGSMPGPYPGDAWVDCRVTCCKADGDVYVKRVKGPQFGWIPKGKWRWV